jgi:hypothetical protein
LVKCYGQQNIAVGSAFVGQAPAQLVELQGFAFYVRDVRGQVEELLEDVLNFECGHQMTRSIDQEGYA